MSRPLATSDPARTFALIQYNFARHQVLASESRITSVNSKASALKWAVDFSSKWVCFMSLCSAVS